MNSARCFKVLSPHENKHSPPSSLSAPKQIFRTHHRQVQPPRAAGVSHDRKIRSYEVESHFYQHIAPQLISDTGLGLPLPVHIEAQSPDSFTFIMGDLNQEFPASPCGDFSEHNLKVRWSRCSVG